MAGIPCRAARSSANASALLLMTQAISAQISPASIRSIIAWRLVPLPDTRTPSRQGAFTDIAIPPPVRPAHHPRHTLRCHRSSRPIPPVLSSDQLFLQPEPLQLPKPCLYPY